MELAPSLLPLLAFTFHLNTDLLPSILSVFSDISPLLLRRFWHEFTEHLSTKHLLLFPLVLSQT